MYKLTNKNIVLDLDSTMVHTSSDIDSFYTLDLSNESTNQRIKYFELTSRIFRSDERRMWTILRPYTKEFLNFCTRYFNKIIIFTAAHEEYANKIKSILEEALGDKITDVVYTSVHCQFPNKKTVHKPLSIFNNNPLLYDVNEYNTLAIDDRNDTFAYNPYNGVLIPPYEPETHEINYEDDCLLKLMGWLSLPEVRYSQDVRTLDKSTIFTTPIQYYVNRLQNE